MAKIAVAWLNESDWPAWCALDDQLPLYEKWRLKIHHAITDAESRGLKTEKITVEPEPFLAWCKSKGTKVGRDSRSAYAAEVLMKRLSAH
jgi:hypothetical protein